MKEFIAVRLLGGMGNQMFEYACARALSLRKGFDLFLDTAALDPKKHTRLAIDKFNIKGQLLDAERKKAVITPHFKVKFKLYKALKIPYKLAQTHLRETPFTYDKRLGEISRSSYLEGLWQNEKYFSDFADEIRADFSLKSVEALQSHRLFEKIENCNSVAVHIRRGDYVSKPKYRKILYVCRKKYYESAFDYISERVENPHFFVASDDPKWVRDNFGSRENMTLIEPSGQFEDFYLMSRCRNAIISNSTFSWWSAWLGENGKSGRITVAPDMWFAPCSKIKADEIIPNRWTKLPTGYFDSEL